MLKNLAKLFNILGYLYLKHMQFIDLRLGHKKIKLFNVPTINCVKLTCF